MKYILYESYVFHAQARFNSLWASDNIDELRGMILRDMSLSKSMIEDDAEQIKIKSSFDFKTSQGELYEIYEIYVHFDKGIGIGEDILIYRYSIVDESYHGDLIPMIMIPDKDEKYVSYRKFIHNHLEGIAKVENENSEKEE